MSVVCRVEKSIGGPAMTVVQLMVFVCARVPLLIDNAARCQLACLIARQNLAIRRQAGDKQSICWLFPVVTVHN